MVVWLLCNPNLSAVNQAAYESVNERAMDVSGIRTPNFQQSSWLLRQRPWALAPRGK